MQAIVNTSENWGIGLEGELLFPIPEDMRFFRQTTLNKVVVMGRGTQQSFPGGHPLKNRVNIVLSSRQGFAPQGFVVCQNLGQLALALQPYPTEDVFVIGGENVYRQLLPYCSQAWVTRVRARKKADTYFPNLDENPDWKLVEQMAASQYEGTAFAFCRYINSKVEPLLPQG